MKKNKKNNNTLIKRSGLVLLLRKSGITRISPEAVSTVEKILSDIVIELTGSMEEEMTTHGRSTLKREDVLRAFERKKEEEKWEI